VAMSNDEVVQLLLQVTGAKDLDDLRDKAQGAKSKLEELAGAADKAEGSTRNFGRSVLEGGRFLQDFAQGGIGGVLNNIEGLATALGGGPGLAGLMTAVGLAAYFAIPPLKAAFSAMVDGSNDVPKAADRLGGLSEALKTLQDRLKELREKGWLTDSELAEYNDATARRVELEKEVTAEKEKQATFDKARKAADAEGLDKDAAAVAQKVVNDSGGPDDAVRRAGRTLLEQSRRSGRVGELEARQRELDLYRRRDERAGRDQIIAKGKDGAVYQLSRDEYYDKLQEQVQEQIDAEAAKLHKEAGDVVASALKGDDVAASRMLSLDPGNVKGWIGATRGGLAHAKDKKLVDQLNAQGTKVEAEWREQVANQDAAEVEAADDLRRRNMEDQEAEYIRKRDAQNKDAAEVEAADARRRRDAEDRETKILMGNRDRAERQREQAARDSLPGNRLRAQEDAAYQTAAGIARQEFPDANPSVLQDLAREAAQTAAGPDVASIRQALQQAVWQAQRKWQAELDAQMGRQQYGGDPYYQ